MSAHMGAARPPPTPGRQPSPGEIEAFKLAINTAPNLLPDAISRVSSRRRRHCGISRVISMAWHGVERRRSLAVLGFALGLAAVYFAALFLFIPIGTEARDYVFHNGYLSLDGRDVRAELSLLVYPIGENSRLVSMAVFALSHQACDLSAPCLNAVQVSLLVACFAAGAWHLQQLLGRPMPAAIAMLCWAISLPVFSAGYWQATQHDKLAFVFALAALSCGLATMRGTPGGFPLGRSLGVLALFVLAINAKEMAFFLPAAAVAQVLLLAPGTTARQKLRAGRVYSAALAYSAFYIVTYLLRLNNGWAGHVLSGSPSGALDFYAGSLTGGHPTSHWSLALLASLVALAAAMARARRGKAPAQGALYARVSLYLAVIFLCSLVLVARAQYPGDYYLMVPLWALLGWIAATCMTALAVEWRLRLAVLACTAMLAACFGAGRAADYRSAFAMAQQLRDARSLYAGYTAIRATCRNGLAGGLKLAFQRRPVGEWWYFRGYDNAPDQLVGAYICQDGQAPAMSYSLTGDDRPDHPGQEVALWNAKLKIMRIAKPAAPRPGS